MKKYIVVIEKEKELTVNFRNIKDMIYDISHIKIVEMYNKLVENDIIPIGIKTDTILFEEKKGTEIGLGENEKFNSKKKYINLDKIFCYESGLGNYKLESCKKVINVSFNNFIKN
jgi:hypothetical protein